MQRDKLVYRWIDLSRGNDYSLDMETYITCLRAMSSVDAAHKLISDYPAGSAEYWKAFDVIAKVSMDRKSKILLANHYLERIPFANSRPYEIFSSVMSVSDFLNVIQRFLPVDAKDRRLLMYHLKPVVRKRAKTAREVELVKRFMQEHDRAS